MNSPLTTPSSWRLMTSKIRFLGDGTGDVYVKCHFSQLSSTSSALLGPWKPYPGGIDHAFRPSLGPSRQNKYRPAATVQLLTKKRSIFLSLAQSLLILLFFRRHRFRKQLRMPLNVRLRSLCIFLVLPYQSIPITLSGRYDRFRWGVRTGYSVGRRLGRNMLGRFSRFLLRAGYTGSIHTPILSMCFSGSLSPKRRMSLI